MSEGEVRFDAYNEVVRMINEGSDEEICKGYIPNGDCSSVDPQTSQMVEGPRTSIPSKQSGKINIPLHPIRYFPDSLAVDTNLGLPICTALTTAFGDVDKMIEIQKTCPRYQPRRQVEEQTT